MIRVCIKFALDVLFHCLEVFSSLKKDVSITARGGGDIRWHTLKFSKPERKSNLFDSKCFSKMSYLLNIIAIGAVINLFSKLLHTIKQNNEMKRSAARMH